MKIAIVGSGIMGKILALSFLELGMEVTIFAKNNASCSMMAAGLLTPTLELDKADFLIHHLGKISLALWPTILATLNTNIYFKKIGAALFAHNKDIEELHHVMRVIRTKLPEQNFQKLAYSPQFQQGYFFADEGQIDAQAFLQTLQHFLLQKGVQYYETEVIHVKPYHVDTVNVTQHFDLVCDCRGLGATGIFNDLRGVRGELIWLRAPNVSIPYPIRILHPRYRLYIVPRPQNIYILGASEIESEDHSEISVRTALELLTLAYAFHSGFSEARILHTFTQCRPTLPHHLPQIYYKKGLIAVNGLYRFGFLLAPLLARDVTSFITKGSYTLSDIWKNAL
jgi:glycine oxidase